MKAIANSRLELTYVISTPELVKLVYRSEKSFENEYHDVVKPFLDEIKPWYVLTGSL